MKSIRTLAIAVITLFSVSMYGQSNISGTYVLGEKNTVVKIEQDGAVYNGKIMSSDNAKAKIGTLMVKDIKETKGKWKGKVYSPKRKEWYDAEFKPNDTALDVTIKKGFFSKTVTWTKQ